jgi:glucokinase
MSGKARTVLLADIGGTNARFALVEKGREVVVRNYAVLDYPTPSDAIGAFLASVGPRRLPSAAALAVAGPVTGGHAELTNGAWRLNSEALEHDTGIARIQLVNDFAALAKSLPHFCAEDLYAIGGGEEAAGSPRAVLGPGTGLGVAIFVPAHDGIVLPTEGGHATLPAEDGREAEILAFLRNRFGHVSAERVLSGAGLESLYEAIRMVDGLGGEPLLNADEISARALGGDCPASLATLKTFCAMLGGFAGNVALTAGARGGIYIAGGIVPRFPEFLAASNFRERFEAKGRFRDWLAPIPTFVVTHRYPAFAGLLAMLED